MKQLKNQPPAKNLRKKAKMTKNFCVLTHQLSVISNSQEPLPGTKQFL